jgi:hypothetical protein
MKQLDTLIISGASITSSPWFTWADIICEILKPKRIINLSARGTGNYYISLSCINAILNSELPSSTLCIPMFTCVDKFDMYLDQADTEMFSKEKHKPINLTGQAAELDKFSFWSTGSHWPLVKEQYLNNFFNIDISCTNNMLMFYALEKLCKEQHVDLLPVFDMDIWSYTEQEMNDYLQSGTPLTTKNFTSQPLASNIKPLLSNQWFEFVSLIGFAMKNNLPIFNSINKLHPPSHVHLDWVQNCIYPLLSQQYHCHPIESSFIKKIELFSKKW